MTTASRAVCVNRISMEGTLLIRFSPTGARD